MMNYDDRTGKKPPLNFNQIADNQPQTSQPQPKPMEPAGSQSYAARLQKAKESADWWKNR
jgi:hypothetical protein